MARTSTVVLTGIIEPIREAEENHGDAMKPGIQCVQTQ
jgi:hypothetical protein